MRAPRPATAADLPAIRRLLEGAGLPADDVEEQLGGFVVIDGEREAGPAAIGGLEALGERVALLRSVVVDPARRGAGLAATVCEALEARARSLGVTRVCLLTETAAGYFARRGYRELGRDTAPEAVRATRQFASLCPASATLMVRELS